MDADGADPDADAGPESPLGSLPGMEQFQRAALDAIGAARVMLEAAEHLVRDPAAIEGVVRTMTTVARAATETVSGFAAEARARSHSHSAPSTPGSGSGHDGAGQDVGDDAGGPSAGDDDDGTFRRITLR